MARRTDIDWNAIERQYRLGQKTDKQIAIEYGVQPSTIGRYAKRHGWVQDKAEEVRARTSALLVKGETAEAGVNANKNANANANPTELEIKAAARLSADVVFGHRKGLSRLMKLRDSLLDELDILTDNKELFGQVGELLDESGMDANGTMRRDKLNEAYRRVISMPERVDALKKLAEIDERVRKGEREAFAIDANATADNPIGDLLKALSQASTSLPIVRTDPDHAE